MPAHAAARIIPGSMGDWVVEIGVIPHISRFGEETAARTVWREMCQGQGDGEEKYFFLVRRTMCSILDSEIMQPRSKHN